MATILGLDIGGANLKAATPDKRAASVPFALWKYPEKLPAALGELVARFPDAGELAVTMTGELCDCFETKRDGVNAILTAVQNVSRSRRIRVWATDGAFVDVETARKNHLKVAAANWHALATFAGQYVPKGRAILIDMGSTTTDVIPILNGRPVPLGLTDSARLESGELVYTGVRRTPVCAVLGASVAAEFFATVHDAYLLLGKVPADPLDRDTADGRPATADYASARLSRMIGGDAETIPRERVVSLAEEVMYRQMRLAEYSVTRVWNELRDRTREQYRRDLRGLPAIVLSGAGEFLTRAVVTGDFQLVTDYSLIERIDLDTVRSLADTLGPEVSACGPAYAVAVLAAERP